MKMKRNSLIMVVLTVLVLFAGCEMVNVGQNNAPNKTIETDVVYEFDPSFHLNEIVKSGI